ncbi:mitogen-activated protein kinase binding protein 1 [Plakobranchus ocellatus]|uniref:Mitogen-activated protein kinase binding protein 1 n=1 Tax=Plakobranchus ocellatus TaxID=259542 RepID=A0AAV4ALW5_9GAST|nr:mitogen-activated protein kinase binding protein 1 [Plakobranchus ocellatus]
MVAFCVTLQDLANADLLEAISPCPSLHHLQKQQLTVDEMSKPGWLDLNNVDNKKVSQCTDSAQIPRKVIFGDKMKESTIGTRGSGLLIPYSTHHRPTYDQGLWTNCDVTERSYEPIGSKAFHTNDCEVGRDSVLKTTSDTQPRDLGELLRKACSRGCPAGVLPTAVSSTNLSQAFSIGDFTDEADYRGDCGKILAETEEGRHAAELRKDSLNAETDVPHKERACINTSQGRRTSSCFKARSPSVFTGMKDLNFTASNGYCLHDDTRELFEEMRLNKISSPALHSPMMAIVDQNLVYLSESPTHLDVLDQQYQSEENRTRCFGSTFCKTFGVPHEQSSKDAEKVSNIPMLEAKSTTPKQIQNLNDVGRGDEDNDNHGDGETVSNHSWDIVQYGTADSETVPEVCTKAQVNLATADIENKIEQSGSNIDLNPLTSIAPFRNNNCGIEDQRIKKKSTFSKDKKVIMRSRSDTAVISCCTKSHVGNQFNVIRCLHSSMVSVPNIHVKNKHIRPGTDLLRDEGIKQISQTNPEMMNEKYVEGFRKNAIAMKQNHLGLNKENNDGEEKHNQLNDNNVPDCKDEFCGNKRMVETENAKCDCLSDNLRTRNLTSCPEVCDLVKEGLGYSDWNVIPSRENQGFGDSLTSKNAGNLVIVSKQNVKQALNTIAETGSYCHSVKEALESSSDCEMEREGQKVAFLTNKANDLFDSNVSTLERLNVSTHHQDVCNASTQNRDSLKSVSPSNLSQAHWSLVNNESNVPQEGETNLISRSFGQTKERQNSGEMNLVNDCIKKQIELYTANCSLTDICDENCVDARGLSDHPCNGNDRIGSNGGDSGGDGEGNNCGGCCGYGGSGTGGNHNAHYNGGEKSNCENIVRSPTSSERNIEKETNNNTNESSASLYSQHQAKLIDQQFTLQENADCLDSKTR